MFFRGIIFLADEVLLKDVFPLIYNAVQEQNCTVRRNLQLSEHGRGWNLRPRGWLSDIEIAKVTQLMQKLDCVSLSKGPDVILWLGRTSTVKETAAFLSRQRDEDMGVSDNQFAAEDVWVRLVPLKVDFFVCYCSKGEFLLMIAWSGGDSI